MIITQPQSFAAQIFSAPHVTMGWALEQFLAGLGGGAGLDAKGAANDNTVPADCGMGASRWR